MADRWQTVGLDMKEDWPKIVENICGPGVTVMPRHGRKDSDGPWSLRVVLGKNWRWAHPKDSEGRVLRDKPYVLCFTGTLDHAEHLGQYLLLLLGKHVGMVYRPNTELSDRT